VKANGGYFPFPNDVIDKLLSKLTGAEFKVLSVIIRQTLGWKKQWDQIANSQFRKKGGLSKSGVMDSLDVLLDNSLVLCEKVNVEGKLPQNWYALYGETNEKARLVRSPDQYDKETGTLIILELVHSVDQLGDELVRSPYPQKTVPKNSLKTSSHSTSNKVTTGMQETCHSGNGDGLDIKRESGEHVEKNVKLIEKIRDTITWAFPQYSEYGNAESGTCQFRGKPSVIGVENALLEFSGDPEPILNACRVVREIKKKLARARAGTALKYIVAAAKGNANAIHYPQARKLSDDPEIDKLMKYVRTCSESKRLHDQVYPGLYELAKLMDKSVEEVYAGMEFLPAGELEAFKEIAHGRGA